jgi:DNA modification methylase
METQIERIPVGKIKPAPYNPRKDLKAGDPEYEKLTKSIKEFDCVEPLVWNRRTRNLVGGHQRFKVLVARGDRKVLCTVVDLPLEKEKTLNLALNKISGAWDDRKLATVLDELVGIPNFDLDLTGFDLPEASDLIDRVLTGDNLAEEDDFDVAGEFQQVVKPRTKPGELIKLGPHRLLCGDSTKKRDLETLLGGYHPRMVFTDPPYGIDYVAIKNKAKVAGDNLIDLRRLLRAILKVPAKIRYICGHWRSFNGYTKVLGLPATLIVWNKSHEANKVMSGHNFHLYNPRHEFIFYYGSQRHIAGVYEENVWNIANKVIPEHPTVKPVKLCMRAILNSSNIGEIVVDLFGGSGSTLIACERANRRCFMMELDPRYCDLIRRRYEADKNKLKGARK